METTVRPLSFVLAFAFFIAAPLLHREADTRLPGIGTFNYTGTPLRGDAPQRIALTIIR
ncbi:MAG: hypothetical protein K2X60_04945 [Xanthobacteraceae bacterium]|nr:hypothetical protein [Xanthobacteraceae bacterium]